MQKTLIQWCDYTSSPIKLRLRQSGKSVNACIKVSEGCKNCFAESITRHWWPKVEGKFPGYTPALMKLGEIVLNEEEVRKLLTFKPKPPFKNGHTPMVFIEDMSDSGGEFVNDEILNQLFAVFALRPDVIFQVLTKRIERMAAYLNSEGRGRIIGDAAATVLGLLPHRQASQILHQSNLTRNIESPNFWLGTSCENQQAAVERTEHLRRCPAAVRFISQEPQLEGITHRNLDGIHWTIQGGESGPKARPFNVEWARSLRDQCKAAGVSYFCKQLGANVTTSSDDSGWGSDWEPLYPMDEMRKTTLLGYRVQLKDSHGGMPSEWPHDLRDCRQFPSPAAAKRGA